MITTISNIRTGANASQDGISLDFVPSLQHPGSVVSGTVNIDTEIARGKGVTEVIAKLAGEVRTTITVRTAGPAAAVNVFHHEGHIIFNLENVLWNLEGVGSSASSNNGLLSIPFEFTIPNDENLPPSFKQQIDDMSAAIQYYVMILGKKEAWYKSNVRIVKPFMFLPFDQSSPPSALSSAGRIWKKEIAIKRGVLFGAAGKVEAEVVLPDVPSLPLFHPIPIYIRIKCYSKPLPHTESSDPSSFKFPLPPTTTTGLDLKLCSHIRISAKGHVRERPLDYASVAGLGKPEKKTQAGGWGQDVQVDVGQPTWVMEGESKKMGRWFQESTFQAPMTLRCPPSFDRRTVRLEYTFELTVPFPGLGNNLTLSVGPVPVSSGIYRDQIERAAGELLDLPPTYWEVAELKEK